MAIIVTGATGTLGTAVVQALGRRGVPVVVFSRDPARARTRVPGARDYVEYGPRVERWRAAMVGASAVVDLAGASLFKPFSGRCHLRRVTRARTLAAARLVEAMLGIDGGPRVFVGASSVGVYGFTRPDDAEVDETWRGPCDAYSEGSQAWEATALDAPSSLRVVLFRMGFVLSHRGGGFPYQLRQAGQGRVGYFGDGRQWAPWIHVDDVAEAFVRALEEPGWSGAYNLVSPRAPRARAFAEQLAELAGAEVRPAPAMFARLFMGAGAPTVLRGRNVVPSRLLDAGFRYRYPELRDAMRRLLEDFSENPA